MALPSPSRVVSTFTSGRAFGYQDVYGPELFPVVRRSLGAKDRISAHFKYSPVTDSTSVLDFSSHELAAGVSFAHLFPSGKSASLGLDYSKISVQLGTATSSSSAVTGSLGYNF